MIYICAQSVFKLHPAFDSVIKDILATDPQGVVVFLQGRRPSWTKLVRDRMKRIFPPSVYRRVIFVPRVQGSENFLALLAGADVALHPFPYGGSKTAADAIAVGLPLVTFPGRYLRGRNALGYFKTMRMTSCCVAGKFSTNLHLQIGALMVDTQSIVPANDRLRGRVRQTRC